jgi:hypothetical protein
VREPYCQKNLSDIAQLENLVAVGFPRSLGISEKAEVLQMALFEIPNPPMKPAKYSEQLTSG